jgi:hypothetical protein
MVLLVYVHFCFIFLRGWRNCLLDDTRTPKAAAEVPCEMTATCRRNRWAGGIVVT